MPTQAPDPIRILAGMRAHDVRYILVGGLAAAAHGSPLDSDEVEVIISGDQDNLEHLALVLDDLEAKPRVVADEHHMAFQTVAGALDCAELPMGIVGFADLYARASDVDVGQGVVVRVAALEDLAELKRASGDLSAAAHLASFHRDPEPAEESAKPRRVWRRPKGEVTTTVDAAAPEGPGRGERLWKALESVDDFLTGLDERRPRSEPKP
jgi:hypothetical protein